MGIDRRAFTALLAGLVAVISALVLTQTTETASAATTATTVTITGTVQSSPGYPLAGVSVQLQKAASEQVVARRTSDAVGGFRFRIDAATAGRYHLAVKRGQVATIHTQQLSIR